MLLCSLIQVCSYTFNYTQIFNHFFVVDMQERCFYCGASENSFIHPDYNCKWVRIAMTYTACNYISGHIAIYDYIATCIIFRYNVINAMGGVT